MKTRDGFRMDVPTPRESAYSQLKKVLDRLDSDFLQLDLENTVLPVREFLRQQADFVEEKIGGEEMATKLRSAANELDGLSQESSQDEVFTAVTAALENLN